MRRIVHNVVDELVSTVIDVIVIALLKWAAVVKLVAAEEISTQFCGCRFFFCVCVRVFMGEYVSVLYWNHTKS